MDNTVSFSDTVNQLRSLMNPATRLVRVINNPIQKLAIALSQVAEKNKIEDIRIEKLISEKSLLPVEVVDFFWVSKVLLWVREIGTKEPAAFFPW